MVRNKGYFSYKRLLYLIIGLVILLSFSIFYSKTCYKKELFKNNNNILSFNEKKYSGFNKKNDINDKIISSNCYLKNFKDLNKLKTLSTVVNNYPYSANDKFILLRYSLKTTQNNSKIIEGESEKDLYVFRVIDTNNKFSINYNNISLPKNGKNGVLVINISGIGTFLFFTKIYFYGTTSFLYIKDFPKGMECINGFYQFYILTKPNNYPISSTGIYHINPLEKFSSSNKKILYSDLDDQEIIYENCYHMTKYTNVGKSGNILPENTKVYKDCLNKLNKKNYKPNNKIEWCLSGLENCYTDFKSDNVSNGMCYMPDLNMNLSPFCNPYINNCEKPDYVIGKHPYYWRNYGKNKNCFGKTTYINETQPVIKSKDLKEPIDLEEVISPNIFCGSGKSSKNSEPNSAGSVYKYRRNSIPIESNILNCFTCQLHSNSKKFFDVDGTHIKFVGDEPPANNKVYDNECPGPLELYGLSSVKCDNYMLSPQ